MKKIKNKQKIVPINPIWQDFTELYRFKFDNFLHNFSR